MTNFDRLADRIATVRSATQDIQPADGGADRVVGTLALLLALAGADVDVADQTADRWASAISRFAEACQAAHEAAVAATEVVEELNKMARQASDERN